MKSIFIYILIVVFNSNSPEYKELVDAGETPIIPAVMELQSMDECRIFQAKSESLAMQTNATLIRNDCVEVSFPTRPEDKL